MLMNFIKEVNRKIQKIKIKKFIDIAFAGFDPNQKRNKNGEWGDGVNRHPMEDGYRVFDDMTPMERYNKVMKHFSSKERRGVAGYRKMIKFIIDNNIKADNTQTILNFAGFDPSQKRNENGEWGSDGGTTKLEKKPCFKKWFDGSKIVDENGNPLKVYHGGANDSISVFDIERAGDIQYSDWGSGVYFSPSKSDAEYYSREAIKKNDSLYNSLYNKYIETENLEDLKAFQNRGRELSSNPNTIVYEVYLSLKNPLIYKAGSMADPNLSNRAIEEGKDGIIILTRSGELDEIVAFNPNQIKSVDAKSFCHESDINLSNG